MKEKCKTVEKKEDKKVVAPVATPKMVTTPTVERRKHLVRRTIAKFAWQLDRSSLTVACMLRNEYKLSPFEEARVLDRVSDMRIAYKYMTALLRQNSNVDVVTLFRAMEHDLRRVE